MNRKLPCKTVLSMNEQSMIRMSNQCPYHDIIHLITLITLNYSTDLFPIPVSAARLIIIICQAIKYYLIAWQLQCLSNFDLNMFIESALTTTSGTPP